MVRAHTRIASVLSSGSLLLMASAYIDARLVQPADAASRPLVSENVAPVEAISPAVADGTRGEGFLRKPPGPGPFPSVLLIHGGIVRWPTQQLRDYALGTWASRFLAAGYVVASITYRSRDIDPQSAEAVQDALAAIAYLRRLPYVDGKSVVVDGASGGGDLALWVASSTDVAAIVAEEPASSIFLGMFNSQTPKRGERFTTEDGFRIHDDPKAFFTRDYQAIAQQRIAKIRCPILIVQGEPTSRLNMFNGQTLIPELRAAHKAIDVTSYPGEPHSFAFYSVASRTPHPAVAAKAFEDISAWLRRHVSTPPVPMDPKLVKQVPI